jgi:Fic-DOC domain mobile mystery protein B
MTDLFSPQDDAATPIDEEEKDALIPSYITTRGELNEAEQRNILEAEEWAFNRKRDALNERFLDNLHNRMFRHVWKWAGKHRRTGKNIGVDAYKIPTELRRMIDDSRYWIDNDTYPPDEIAARFHHRLVWVHPYPNGNGRHARLATDLLLKVIREPRFTWGRDNLVDAGHTRERYVEALRAADNHDFAPLINFVRS